jgi:hypothetical protein
MLMARACDKLGRDSEALVHYKRARDLLPGSPVAADERNARQEAERRIKAIDPIGPKVDQAVDEYLRKLDSLERDALTARSMSAMERIFKLRGHTWMAQGFSELSWQDSGFPLVAGQKYHARAAGSWTIKGHFTVTAAGTAARPGTAQGKAGQLLGHVADKFFVIGEDSVFTAPASGTLLLMCNEDQPARVECRGSIPVLVEAPR